jgi:ABC-type multidrug transport system fused ATPase/permease subunit
MTTVKKKSFWQKPEGVTGLIFLAGLAIGGGVLLYSVLPALIALLQNVVYLSIFLLIIAAVAYVIIDPRMRNLVWYMYKSFMRWITGLFVQLDPIAILKSYVEELKENLRKMNKQISKLRGQMHKLKEIIVNNERAIQDNIELASKAKENNKRDVMILKSRKAGRLKESNMRLGDLYKKMEVMYRVLTRMYENSAILAEDVQDQVAVKEQERKAIHASHSAMQSARSIISGDPDRRAMFDAAMEAVADDVAGKMGEMERFMEMSSSFMDSIDLQNGIFEEEGLKMLEEWEKKGASLILGEEKDTLLLQANNDEDVLDLDAPVKEPVREAGHRNQYDDFFE